MESMLCFGIGCCRLVGRLPQLEVESLVMALVVAQRVLIADGSRKLVGVHPRLEVDSVVIILTVRLSASCYQERDREPIQDSCPRAWSAETGSSCRCRFVSVAS